MGSDSHEMSEDHNGGYRGWGAATTVAGAASSRKLSTTLSHTQNQLSDAGSNMYAPAGNSPGYDAHSADPLMSRDPRRETMSSEEMGSLGMGALAGGGAAATGAAAAASHNNTSRAAGGIQRGPSNASSTYSAAAGAGARSDVSDDRPDMPIGHAYDYNSNYGYSQHGPYGDGTYGGSAAPGTGGDAGGMPVVRDVSARRNTRIQQPSVGQYPTGNAGISQNF
jgi:hypothetical protein